MVIEYKNIICIRELTYKYTKNTKVKYTRIRKGNIYNNDNLYELSKIKLNLKKNKLFYKIRKENTQDTIILYKY